MLRYCAAPQQKYQHVETGQNAKATSCKAIVDVQFGLQESGRESNLAKYLFLYK